MARGIDRRLQEELDAWLSYSLENARLADPECFADRYDSAPQWFLRVVDAAHGEEGVLVPSIDGVGRRFPLFIGHPLVPAMEPGRLAAALADTAREAIVSGWCADRLSMVQIEPDAGEWYTDPPLAADAIWWTPATERNATMLREGHRPPDLIAAMLAVGDAIR